MAPELDRRSLLTGAALAGLGGTGAAYGAAGDLQTLVEAERSKIRAAMAKDQIGAVAVCLVRDGEPVWAEGFGQTAADGQPVAQDTIFSIQSTSKNFTAVAVLLAVQDGLLDLDLPISRYLPDFSVNSRFERSPQDKITLRLLLSNRAGFTHEAPVGNNYEPRSPSFEAHARSISRTWLRFPVGERYRYSNLGYDLAGYILERRTGLSYAEWLRRKLFEPLGMGDSTADPALYAKVANRAVGAHRGYAQTPLVTPLVASGGVYTSARDMAAYGAFHLAEGAWGGRQVLARELWAQMHGFGYGGDYGMGAMRTELAYGSTPVRLLHHRGGGFGFGCNFVYCPEAGLAWAALFNRPALAGYGFGAELIDKLLAARLGERTPRLSPTALAPIAPPTAQRRRFIGAYVGRDLRGEISEAGGELYLKQRSDPPVRLLMSAPDELLATKSDGRPSATDIIPPRRRFRPIWNAPRARRAWTTTKGRTTRPARTRPNGRPISGATASINWASRPWTSSSSAGKAICG